MILNDNSSRSRRAFLKKAFAGVAASAAGAAAFGQSKPVSAYEDTAETARLAQSRRMQAALPDRYKDKFRITKLETFKVKRRFLFLKIHTDHGIVGLGEPITEGRADTCAEAVREIAPYLIGKDPRRVIHHWQAIYRHAFYRGGPILTSALSGIEQALWDIKGKALGVPVYELLGGPTRHRIRTYAHARSPEAVREAKKEGFTTFKTGVRNKLGGSIIANNKQIAEAVDYFAELRQIVGDDCDIGIDFHGAITPANAKLLIKELEPFNPWFIEEPIQCQDVGGMAEIARGTHLPIATGERIFTKWGFRDILEQRAATILQPDLCHAGGIFEGRIIAGMAEAYYGSIAPHNPLGPISLACGLQLAASIPNFLCQEQVTLGEGYIKEPFKVVEGHIPLPTGPGLGIELDEDALADKLGHDWRNPETYNESDGSVVDW